MIETGGAVFGAAKGFAAALIAIKASKLAAAGMLPFFVVAAAGKGGVVVQPNLVRIIEAVIIGIVTAALTAAGTVYVTVAVMGHRVTALERGQDEIKSILTEFRKDLYQPRVDSPSVRR